MYFSKKKKSVMITSNGWYKFSGREKKMYSYTHAFPFLFGSVTTPYLTHLIHVPIFSIERTLELYQSRMKCSE